MLDKRITMLSLRNAMAEQIKALQNVVIEIKNQSLLHTEKEDGNS
jgi:hypothetical protein